MERIPSSPPIITPLPANEQRPLLSVMIPVYNCAQFLPIVLESVLSQDMGAALMQIEVVDDASTDADVAAIVQQLGKGRVSYYRQPENVGSLRNFETCINRSRGQLVHLLHGDDRVKAGFYKKLSALFEQYPEAGAAFCNYCFIDDTGKITHGHPPEAKEAGILKDWLPRIAELQRIQYVTIVVRRQVYEKLGSFYGMTYGEDWEMWVRIARYYPIAYTPEILAEYRLHSGSISSRMGDSGENIPCLLKSHTLIQEHIMQENLSAKDKKKIIDKGKQHCALHSILLAYRIWKKTHNKLLALEFVKTALSLSKTPLIYFHVFKFYIKVAISF
jgi:glycosyltransferase involved in cell wall biosynthesis